MQKIKKDDIVVVIAGKDKGKKGKVLKILVDKNRVLIEGANIVKKHIKANPQRNQLPAILDIEASMHISNVAIYNPQTKKADRVIFKITKDSKKSRYFKSSNEPIDI